MMHIVVLAVRQYLMKYCCLKIGLASIFRLEINARSALKLNWVNLVKVQVVKFNIFQTGLTNRNCGKLRMFL